MFISIVKFVSVSLKRSVQKTCPAWLNNLSTVADGARTGMYFCVIFSPVLYWISFVIEKWELSVRVYLLLELHLQDLLQLGNLHVFIEEAARFLGWWLFTSISFSLSVI